MASPWKPREIKTITTRHREGEGISFGFAKEKIYLLGGKSELNKYNFFNLMVSLSHEGYYVDLKND